MGEVITDSAYASSDDDDDDGAGQDNDTEPTSRGLGERRVRMGTGTGERMELTVSVDWSESGREVGWDGCTGDCEVDESVVDLVGEGERVEDWVEVREGRW